ncbi:MAG: prepilin-type N-terminal cleavage/methylation domain-containing protein [Myxococcales bacterium]|nr:prepilin-type N-terminal cleavage/methylation domain-containing protein [Myxococcales bacterium]
MRRARGFTLMEVMVAIGITGLMGGMIGMAFHTGMRAKETVEADAERYRMLRTAMSRMSREIGAAFVSDRYDAKRYRDAYDRPTNFVGARDRLLYSSLAHQRLYSDAKESDQMVVEYTVKTSTERDARGRQDIVRRENPNLDERMDRGGTEEVLFEGVKRLELEYWDSEKKEWDDEWDTRRPERKSILPTRVRITITALDENGKEAKYATQTRVMLNTEFQRFQ